MTSERAANRRQKLLRQLKKTGTDALLITNPINVSYLTGFTGDDSFLLLGSDVAVIISDSRFSTQLEEECPEIDAVIRTSSVSMNGSVSRTVKQAGINRLGFESQTTSFQQWERLDQDMKSLELVPVDSVVEKIRQVKDKFEIGETRRAVHMAQRGFEVIKASLTSGQTEIDVANELEHTMRGFGASGVAFPSIVAVGPRSALPHAHPTRKTIGESDFVLFDWGAETFSGYRSDITRVITTGKPSARLKKIYEVVRLANRRAIEAIRPGARCCDIDKIARDVISQAGYGKNFGHGLGHGVGRVIHEHPRLSPTDSTELRAGMIVTVEPGIYLPGFGGVRLEDDVLVTRGGCEVLTSLPLDYEESIVAL